VKNASKLELGAMLDPSTDTRGADSEYWRSPEGTARLELHQSYKERADLELMRTRKKHEAEWEASIGRGALEVWRVETERGERERGARVRGDAAAAAWEKAFVVLWIVSTLTGGGYVALNLLSEAPSVLFRILVGVLALIPFGIATAIVWLPVGLFVGGVAAAIPVARAGLSVRAITRAFFGLKATPLPLRPSPPDLQMASPGYPPMPEAPKADVQTAPPPVSGDDDAEGSSGSLYERYTSDEAWRDAHPVFQLDLCGMFRSLW